MNGILQLRRGGTKRKAPSKSFREKKKAQFKQRKKDELEKIVSSKSDDNTSGIAGVKITGKNKAGKEVSDVIPANIPEKFHDFLIRNKGTQAAQSIIDNYASTAVNPYAAQIQRFKESPGGIEAFKERFPNPLVKAARGLGKFFEEGTFLGKILSSLNPSDKKKAEIIVDESRRQPYNVDEGIMSYMDKIRRDQMLKNKREGITYSSPDMGIMLGQDIGTMYDKETEDKRRFIEQYTKQNAKFLTKPQIELSYEKLMDAIQRNASGDTDEQYQKAAFDDFSNFQNINEQVVDEATGTGDPGDQLRFELGGSDLSGSVSETDYSGGGTEGNQAMADLDQMGLAVPGSVVPGQFDIITSSGNPAYADTRGQDFEDLMSGVTSGAFDSSGFAQQKNMGGYMGMSTFDKLKMIAQGMADDRSK